MEIIPIFYNYLKGRLLAGYSSYGVEETYTNYSYKSQKQTDIQENKFSQL